VQANADASPNCGLTAAESGASLEPLDDDAPFITFTSTTTSAPLFVPVTLLISITALFASSNCQSL
jgi:hypothetical protein